MATTAPIMERNGGGLAGAWARIRPLAAVGVLLGLSMGFIATTDWQNGVSRGLSTIVRGGVEAGGLDSLVLAGLAFAGWLAWLLARALVFSAVFFLVELLLVGAPRNWRETRFRLSVQVTYLLFFQLAGPVLDIVLPIPLLGAPLVTVEVAWLTPLLGMFAPLLLALVALLLSDFMGYWIHRAMHAVPLLWRFHSVHHSMTELDSLAYVHPVDVVCQRVGVMLIGAAIGLQFEAIALIVAFQTMHERLLHSRAPIHLGPLGPVLVDNRRHFVHHTIIDEHAGCNFAATFTHCDRLFGTYRPPYPDGLCETGLGDKLPPRTLGQFFLARLERRPEA